MRNSDAGRTVAMLAPLLIWGAYFLLVYVLVALACAGQLALEIVQPTLWVISAAAILSITLLGGRFRQRLRRAAVEDADRRFLLSSGLLLSLVSLIATAWTALPILVIAPCT